MKNQKGITLIALVITIIVLLILAGVSIAMLTGENGILTQANSSKSETNKSEAIERISLALNAVKAKVYEMEVGSATYNPIGDSTGETGADQDDLEKAITSVLKLDQIVPRNTTTETSNDGKYVYELDGNTLILSYYNTTTNVGSVVNDTVTAVKGTIDLNNATNNTHYLEISTVALGTLD